MANKLKNLKVKKVDFVDEGANQRADIKLLKSKNGTEEIPDQEIGLFKRFVKWLTGELSEDGSPVKKSATTFNEQINAVSMDEIRDEIWSVCYALQNSLNSILCDAELDATGKQNAMENSTDQFAAAMKGYISKWCTGATASIRKNIDAPDETDLLMITKARSNLEEIIEKSNNENEKGELEEMLKIDKSKMTAEERTAYDEIIKKYAVDTEETPVEKSVNPECNEDEIEDCDAEKKKDCKKSAGAPPSSEPPILDDNDIYKGLHPAVKAEIELLRKFRENAENSELESVAKKYAAIGKKPEELIPLLKSLKAAGGTAYNDMISILDSTLAMANTSGAFSEIGKSGSYTGPVGIKKSESENKIDQIAKGYLEKDPSMDMTTALAKAWEDHPELMEDYEGESGF